MEGLRNLFQTARANGWIRGFKIGENTRNSRDHSSTAVSGLHIDWNKRIIYPVNTIPNIEDLAYKLGGKVGELPTTYLGMPLGAKSKSSGIWSGVIEKCERKLVNWKCQYLSSGSRLTLVNSVLDALPSYMMSIFPIPAKVTKRSISIEGSNNSKIWHGGQVDDGGGTSPYDCSVWRSIRNLWLLVKDRTKCKVGNGEKVAFWNDIWCGQETLKQAFPELHSLSQAQEASVED
ncbi:hypothetical protein MTR67_037900 [Solanum verrucosum]|uniref:Uncharacterized protein n=1 Tax=Solanum verrucosum TaxID=315347 RepID=A0AAF0UEB2_SOLVR|nr:hypothetical protein MTR67_037900 [Solanum verrucosum]